MMMRGPKTGRKFKKLLVSAVNTSSAKRKKIERMNRDKKKIELFITVLNNRS